MLLPFLMGDDLQSVYDGAPNFKKWNDTMMARPAVAKVAQDKAKVMAQQ